jgi:hypothetical protein
MKKRFFGFALCGLLVLLASPESGYAYFTKSQSAERLDDQGVLYSITYDFGMEKYDLYLPIVPARSVATEAGKKDLTYTILDESEDVSGYGETVGVVVSNAEMRNGMYFVPKGEAKRFTLIVLLVEPETAPKNSLDLALQVTNLPFTMKKEGLSLGARLNPSELKYYITPEVDVLGVKL